MLGSLTGGTTSSPSQNRVFIYEVTGLKQGETNDNNSYPFRSSSSVFMRVPYTRMNEEMQRIGKMGGTIVNIQTLENFQKPNDISDENTNNSED